MNLFPELLVNAKIVFWDFDGVIKESVNVKTKAFIELFTEFGPSVVDQVREHHEANGGMSRFKKIPFYFEEFVGLPLGKDELQSLYDKFADLVEDSVVVCPWVPGVEMYLRANSRRQRFVLVTGTPKVEIDSILGRLGLIEVFSEVYGAPTDKGDAVSQVLANARSMDPRDCVFVGDATIDWEAANENFVPFLLRRSPLNEFLQKRSGVICFDDFMSITKEHRKNIRQGDMPTSHSQNS